MHSREIHNFSLAFPKLQFENGNLSILRSFLGEYFRGHSPNIQVAYLSGSQGSSLPKDVLLLPGELSEPLPPKPMPF